jgi:acyl carrier protein
MTGTAPEAVPRAAKDLSCDYRAPATELQRALVRMWRQHLRVDPIGVDDDFFELGGHSLLAADLLVATESTVGVRVPARVLYLQPTIAELAEAIDGIRAEGAGS